MSNKVLISSGVKDESGAYTRVVAPSPPVAPEPTPELPKGNLTIDELLQIGLNQIERLMICVGKDISTGVPSRESVMNLKDCMSMLHELKKKEQELLDALSDDELKTLTTPQS